jgi:hypothetical protein
LKSNTTLTERRQRPQDSARLRSLRTMASSCALRRRRSPRHKAVTASAPADISPNAVRDAAVSARGDQSADREDVDPPRAGDLVERKQNRRRTTTWLRNRRTIQVRARQSNSRRPPGSISHLEV